MTSSSNTSKKCQFFVFGFFFNTFSVVISLERDLSVDTVEL